MLLMYAVARKEWMIHENIISWSVDVEVQISDEIKKKKKREKKAQYLKLKLGEHLKDL